LIPQKEPGIASSIVGLPRYMAPEMLKDDVPYTFKVDVWSSGILLYFMCTKRYPYPGLNIKTEILIDAPTLELPPKRFSDDFRKLVSSILNKEASVRPTFTEILAKPIISK
jgi:serine/threonine protein kinase